MKKFGSIWLVMMIMVTILSVSCSNNKPSNESATTNPEMWKVLTESDWAGYLPGSGCEMKFIGHDKAIIMEWVEDPATKVWSRTGSDVGTVEFIDDTWFIISYKNRNTAYLFSKSSNSFENSNGAVFTKSKINSFHQKN